MSLLDIVQHVCPLIGLPVPASVIGNNNALVKSLLHLSHNGGMLLARSNSWQILTKRVTFAGIAANAQTGQPPGAYDRFSAVQRIWDGNRDTWLVGPLSTDEWDGILVQPQTAYPTYWTMLNGVINIAPAPATTDSFTYTYISKNWIRPSGGSGPTDTHDWEADTDEPLLDEVLLELDLIWRFKQSKGLDYAEDMATFEREKEKAIARDRGPRSIKTTRAWRGDPPGTFWPGSITEI